MSTTRKVAETHNSKAEQDTGGTRKRRRIDCDAVPTAWHDKDNNDSDYEREMTTMIRSVSHGCVLCAMGYQANRIVPLMPSVNDP